MTSRVNRRIAFLGGKPLSARCLTHLHSYHAAGEIEIVAVLPRPKGERGWWSAPGVPEMFETAEQLGLPIIRHEDELAALEFDLGISVLYWRLLPARLVARPRHGFLNLHCAPLPQYRGCNVCTHAILNGAQSFGATLHFMDDKPDHGDIVRVESFDVPSDVTAQQLMTMTEETAFKLFRGQLPAILGNELRTVSQQAMLEAGTKVSRYYPRNSLSAPGAKEVDLSWPAERIDRHVRAFDFPPFEPAYCVVNGRKIHMTAANRVTPLAVPRELEATLPNEQQAPFSIRVLHAPPKAPITPNDLLAQHAPLKRELTRELDEIIESSAFIGGSKVSAFAEAFATYCGVKHAIPCSNGTEALRLAILGVLGQGDGTREIVTVSHTFAATVEAIIAAGYRPVLLDVDPETYLMDLDAVSDACTPLTAGIVPVHLYGQMVDMRRLHAIALDRHAAIIEDAAQAHGARTDGIGPGQLSDAAAFSFFPGKNLGAWGDAGAVVCNDDEAARRIVQWSDHGRSDKYTHATVGGNARMDGIQAAVLGVKLRYLDTWNESRRAVAAWYDQWLADVPGCVTPAVQPGAEHVYHQYVIQVGRRDAVRAALSGIKIASGIHYPVPVHEQPAYRYLGLTPTSLPNTHALCKRILSLPIHPHLTRSAALRVAEGVYQAVVRAPVTVA